MCRPVARWLEADDSFPVWWKLLLFSAVLYIVPWCLVCHVLGGNADVFTVSQQEAGSAPDAGLRETLA